MLLRSLIYLIVFSLFGCDYGERVLGRRPLELDPREVFPAFSKRDSDSTGQDRISNPCADESESSHAVEMVTLGNYFQAQIPSDWSSQGTPMETLIVDGPGSLPESGFFVYLKAIAPDSDSASDLQQFHRRVDHRLQIFDLLSRLRAKVAKGVVKAIPSENANLPVPTNPEESDPSTEADTGPSSRLSKASPAPARAGGLGETESTEALAMPELESIGVPGTTLDDRIASGGEPSELPATVAESELAGPGYRSEVGTYSGWKWIGQCAAPPRVVVQESETDDDNQLDTVREQTKRAFLRLSRSHGTWQRADGNTDPAFQILGTVSLPTRHNYGMHLAIVCTEAPDCPSAPDLARFLGSIRVKRNGAADVPSMGGSANLQQLAVKLGIGDVNP